MSFPSFEGRGYFGSQCQRDYQASLTTVLQYRERAAQVQNSLKSGSNIARTESSTEEKTQLFSRKRQRIQRSRKILSRHLTFRATRKYSSQLWTSPFTSNRSREDSQILGSSIPTLCLRTADGVTRDFARQRASIHQRCPRQKLLKLLIVVRAAQVHGSSRDATGSQQLEVSVVNRDADSAHSAFLELQKSSDNGRPNAETCNGLLQCKPLVKRHYFPLQSPVSIRHVS